MDFLDDIRSDMSVFHRVDDLESMPAARFFSMARRLPHYEGAMRHIVIRESREHEPEPSTPGSEQRFEPSPGNDDAIAASVDLMSIHPVWGSIGSYSKAPAID